MRTKYTWAVAVLLAIVLIGTSAAIYKQNQVKEANLNNEIQQLKEQSKARSEADKQKLQKRELELQQQVRELNEKLQTKAAEKARIAAQEAEKRTLAQRVVQSAVPTAQASQVPVSGSKVDWMRAAGIPEAHWGMVDILVTRESGWDPNNWNGKSRGVPLSANTACGLGQQLPCGKWAGAWNDPVAALVAMTGYVNSRYGGWAGAVAFWNANHYY